MIQKEKKEEMKKKEIVEYEEEEEEKSGRRKGQRDEEFGRSPTNFEEKKKMKREPSFSLLDRGGSGFHKRGEENEEVEAKNSFYLRPGKRETYVFLFLERIWRRFVARVYSRYVVGTLLSIFLFSDCYCVREHAAGRFLLALGLLVDLGIPLIFVSLFFPVSGKTVEDREGRGGGQKERSGKLRPRTGGAEEEGQREEEKGGDRKAERKIQVDIREGEDQKGIDDGKRFSETPRTPETAGADVFSPSSPPSCCCLEEDSDFEEETFLSCRSEKERSSGHGEERKMILSK